MPGALGRRASHPATGTVDCVGGHARRTKARPRVVPIDALTAALDPFDGFVDELIPLIL